MPKSNFLERILSKAKEKEKKYDWIGAVEFHKKASAQVLKQKDFLKAGEVQERIGYSFYRAAFQAGTRESFKNRMESAVEVFGKAVELFDNFEGLEKLAKTSHCRAMVAYVNSWIAEDLSGRKAQLNSSWRLEQETLKLYEEAADHMNVGKTCSSLMMFLIDLLDMEWNARSREEIVDKGLEYGERAIEIFSKSEDKQQLPQAYTLTASLYRNAAFARGFNIERREECRKKALSYSEKAIEISEKIGDVYLIGLSHFRLADVHLDILGATGIQERQHFEKALQCGILTKDNLLVANAMFGLAFAASFSAVAQEDPDKAREEYRRLDEQLEDAVDHYNIIARHLGIADAYSYGLWPIEQRSAMETNLKTKRLLIEKSIKLGCKGLEHARLSGSMGVTFHMTLTLGTAIVCLARVETDTGRKRRLLEDSSKYIEESISILKGSSACAKVEPREGNLGVCISALALNQAELASMENTVDQKIKMLKNAITNMRSSHEYLRKWVKSPWAHAEKPHWFIIGRTAMTLGKTLSQLYVLTRDVTVLGDSIKAFELSVEDYQKADSPFSRVAESYWELAKTYDKMGNHIESARHFKLASDNYTFAAKKTPQLKEFYQDHASYMESWSEIEKAKHHHLEKRYGRAREHYQKVAALHNSTERWNYLSPNYSAWAKLEEAEDLSRKEQDKEAKVLFQEAADLFAEAQKCIKAKLERIETVDEKEMASELVKASDIRREYCLGRTALEEAKALDRKGDHTASSRKYGFAAEKFQKAFDATEHKSDRQELRPIVCLSQAWQMMTQAEAEALPELYLEASKLFDEAKKHSNDERAKILALGHSLFCKALEAGTKFAATRDTTLHSTATQHLEGAADYYVRAGFKTASEYAKATQRLFDAYVYMHNAKTETEPGKKAQYYRVAERLLQASADSYMKAKHSEKSEEVGRLLESVKEERQLAMSLTDVLHAPTTTSTTTSFSTPTPTHEQAVGLERFEHADIQANLLPRMQEVNIGEDVSLEMEFVNTGQGPALLIRVEDIITEGFKLRDKPDMYRVEDHYLNMKGKRLDPLKTEEVKIVLRPLNKGVFHLKPKVLYLDETGEYKSHKPEPVTVTVRELGISGWIKGR